jgi:hypothetical protein
VRIAAARDQVGDRDPVRRDRRLREQAQRPGDLLRGLQPMASPSSRTRPRVGLSIRDRARSSVDLPQAFGPTITVKELSGISTERFSAMTRWS